jgi:DNA-directed RNA polymerase specialized sigma subunit
MQLITKLDSLSENDQQILNALKYQDGAQKRVEELLVGILRVCFSQHNGETLLDHAIEVCTRFRYRAVSSS